MKAAPVRQFTKAIRTREGDVMRDVHLDAGSKLQPTPDRTIRGSGNFFHSSAVRGAVRGADLVEGATCGLQFFDLKQPIDMSLCVVTSAPDAERRRNQPLLYVVPNCSTRDVGQIGQVLNRVARLVGHRPLI